MKTINPIRSKEQILLPQNLESTQSNVVASSNTIEIPMSDVALNTMENHSVSTPTSAGGRMTSDTFVAPALRNKRTSSM